MSKTSAEFEIEVSRKEDIFVKVPASELSLDDEFMQYPPKTDRERIFKERVEQAIKNGLKDFWRPVCDPSFDTDGRICYELRKKPAVGQCHIWWAKNAKKFCPERNSRLGTKSEYIAFLAVLIKELVASGKSVELAWDAVCNDSKELGHYWNSKDAKHHLETTGSREVCGWYDLANICKVLAEDKNTGGFWLTCGNYVGLSSSGPLAVLYHKSVLYYDGKRYDDNYCSCGWLVLDSCPEC